MHAQTLKKFNQFGKVGKLVLTLLLIAAVIFTLLCGAAAIYTATLPKDAVRVTVTNLAEFRVKGTTFSAFWNFLSDGVSYAAGSDPTAMLEGGSMLPPENTQLQANFKFFNQGYASAEIRSDGSDKIMDAQSAPAEYSSSSLVMVFVFATLFVASVAAALWMLQKLFRVLSECASPFCPELVSRLRGFGYSLLPVAVFATIGETLARRFLSAGQSGIQIQWGILIAFAVTMCLVTVFRYGVQLQTESDETL